MNFTNLHLKLISEVDYRTVHSSDPSRERSIRGVDTAQVTQFTDVDPKRKKNPADKGFKDERSAQALIRNSIRLLKTDNTFRDKLNSLFGSYRSELQQESDINAATEKILIYTFNNIQKAQSQLSSLEEQRNAIERVLDKPDLSDSAREHYMIKLNGDPSSPFRKTGFNIKDKDTGENKVVFQNERENPGILFKIAKLEKSIKRGQEEVDAALQKATSDVVPIADKYIDPLIELINTTAEDLLQSTQETEPTDNRTVKSLDEINPDDFSPEKLLEANVRIELLKMLASSDPEHNPVVRYLDMKAQAFNIDKVKDIAYGRGYNVNISKNLINNALPISQLVRYYNFIRDDEPLKILSSLQTKTKGKANEAIALLNIKTEQEFKEKKEALAQLINSLNIDEGRKNAALAILNEPFIRRGKTAADRLRGLLGGVISDMTKTITPDPYAGAWDENEESIEGYDRLVNSYLHKAIF